MKSDPQTPQNSRFDFFAQAPDVDLIAHRGGNGQWPGETTYAFTRALDSGADVIEMDVWGTADDPPVLVLMHSPEISKVTEGSGKVSSESARLDRRQSRRHAASNSQRRRRNHHRLPRSSKSNPRRARSRAITASPWWVMLPLVGAPISYSLIVTPKVHSSP